MFITDFLYNMRDIERKDVFIMIISPNKYSITKFCSFLGENRRTISRKWDDYSAYWLSYFDFEYIEKARGGDIILKEEFDTSEYVRYNDKRKQEMDKDYRESLAEELKDFPHNTAANIARSRKDVRDRWEHKTSTAARKYGTIINEDYNKHWDDTAWVWMKTDGKYEYLKDINENEVNALDFWKECLREQFKSNFVDRKQVVLLYCNGHFSWEETGNIIKAQEEEKYFNAVCKFAEKWRFIPRTLPKIDQEPLTAHEIELNIQKQKQKDENKLARKLQKLEEENEGKR